MRRKRWLTIVILAAALATLYRSGPAKELNPLQGGFAPETIIAVPGQNITLTLSIEPLRAFAKVQLILTVPDGMLLTKGEATTLLTDLKPGKSYKNKYVLRVNTADPRELWARAVVLGLPAGEYIAQSYLAQVNPVEKPDDSRIEDDGTGRKIRVIEVP